MLFILIRKQCQMHVKCKCCWFSKEPIKAWIDDLYIHHFLYGDRWGRWMCRSAGSSSSSTPQWNQSIVSPYFKSAPKKPTITCLIYCWHSRYQEVLWKGYKYLHHLSRHPREPADELCLVWELQGLILELHAESGEDSEEGCWDSVPPCPGHCKQALLVQVLSDPHSQSMDCSLAEASSPD